MTTDTIDVFETVRLVESPTVRWAATVHNATGRVIASSGVQDDEQTAIDTATRNAPAAA